MHPAGPEWLMIPPPTMHGRGEPVERRHIPALLSAAGPLRQPFRRIPSVYAGGALRPQLLVAVREMVKKWAAENGVVQNPAVVVGANAYQRANSQPPGLSRLPEAS